MFCSKEPCGGPIYCKKLCRNHYGATQYARNAKKYRVAKKIYYESHKEEAKARGHTAKRSPISRYSRARDFAKRRGKEFSITREDYFEAISHPCFYCQGHFPKTETSIGLDRLDNFKGYTKDNVVSCCYVCNMVRGRHFTVEETKVALDAVLAHRRAQK